MKRLFRLPVTLDSSNRKKDRTVGLRFTSNLEVANEEFAEIDTFYGESGWLIFSDNEIDESDVPTVDAPLDPGTKTQAQRLRAVLFIYWEQSGRVEPFATFYDRTLETIITKYKEQLK